MKPFPPVTTGRETEEVTVDLVAAEAAEAAEAAGPGTRADGDDIAVVTSAEPAARPRTRLLVIGGAAVLAALLAVVAAIAVSSGDDDPAPISTDAERKAAPADEAPSAPQDTEPATAAVVENPAEAVAPPATVAPSAPPAPAATVAPAAPPAAPGAAAAPPSEPQFAVSLEPNAVTTYAGAPLTVTLHVRNTGAAGDYVYDDDGCDPALVPQPDQICTMVTRVLSVEAGAEASIAIGVDTRGAPPGQYAVPIGGLTLAVTITG